MNIRIQTIGKESGGKSSIVENVLKMEITPRAENIMTKCPLRLETTKSTKSTAEIEWRGVTRSLSSPSAILAEVKNVMISLGGEEDTQKYRVQM